MLKSNPPYAIWSVWKYLGLYEKLFFLSLCIVGAYFLFSAAAALFQLGSRSRNLQAAAASAHVRLSALQKQTVRFEQVLGAAFYLFGLLLFLDLQRAYITVDESRTPVGWLIVMNFAIQFAYAANVFFVFLILFIVKWFVSGRVKAYGSMFNVEA
jgi:hypothetical protein